MMNKKKLKGNVNPRSLSVPKLERNTTSREIFLCCSMVRKQLELKTLARGQSRNHELELRAGAINKSWELELGARS